MILNGNVDDTTKLHCPIKHDVGVTKELATQLDLQNMTERWQSEKVKSKTRGKGEKFDSTTSAFPSWRIDSA